MVRPLLIVGAVLGLWSLPASSAEAQAGNVSKPKTKAESTRMGLANQTATARLAIPPGLAVQKPTTKAASVPAQSVNPGARPPQVIKPKVKQAAQNRGRS